MPLQKDSYSKVAKQNATKQTVEIDQITEDTPILATMPTMISSHDLHNVAQEITEIKGGDMVDLDSTLPSVYAIKGLKQVSLAKIGGEMSIGTDTAKKMDGGDTEYFNSQLVPVAKKTSERVECSLIYDNILATAIDKRTVGEGLINAGGSVNANYSMACVRWGVGENIGLVGKDAFSDGLMFELEWLNGGNVHKIDDGNGNMINGTAAYFENYLGIQLLNFRHIGAIVNIDIANSNLPSWSDITKLLIDCRAGNNTAIYMHPALKQWIGDTFKLDQVQLINNDREVNSLVDGINGIPIVTSFNFKYGTEGNVTL